MPYTTPTAQQLKTRHPAFVDLDSDYVDAVIADAARLIDSTWFEADYQPAIMYLAAHMMTLEGNNDGDDKGVVVSERIGDASASYAAPGAQSSVSDYQATSYGRRYLQLLRVNQPAILASS